MTSRIHSESPFDQLGGFIVRLDITAETSREPQDGVAITIDWGELGRPNNCNGVALASNVTVR